MKKPKRRKARRPADKRRRDNEPAAKVKRSPASFKASALLWIGIVGLTLTVLNGVQSFLELAKWASYVVQHWNGATQTAWTFVFSLFGLNFSAFMIPPLNFVFSLMAVGFSAAILENHHDANPREPAFSVKFLERCAISFGIAALSLIFYVCILDNVVFGKPLGQTWSDIALTVRITVIVAAIAALTGLLAQSRVEAIHGLLLSLFIAAFYAILTAPTALQFIAKGSEAESAYRSLILKHSFGILPSQMVAYLNAASPRYLNYRFAVVALSILTIVALSLAWRHLSTLAPS